MLYALGLFIMIVMFLPFACVHLWRGAIYFLQFLEAVVNIFKGK